MGFQKLTQYLHKYLRQKNKFFFKNIKYSMSQITGMLYV